MDADCQPHRPEGQEGLPPCLLDRAVRARARPVRRRAARRLHFRCKHCDELFRPSTPLRPSTPCAGARSGRSMSSSPSVEKYDLPSTSMRRGLAARHAHMRLGFCWTFLFSLKGYLVTYRRAPSISMLFCFTGKVTSFQFFFQMIYWCQHEFPGFNMVYWLASAPHFLLSCGVQPLMLPSTLPSHPPARHVTGPPPSPPPPRTAGQRPADAPGWQLPQCATTPALLARLPLGLHAALGLSLVDLLAAFRPPASRRRQRGSAAQAAGRALPFPAILKWFTGRRSSFQAQYKPSFWVSSYIVSE